MVGVSSWCWFEGMKKTEKRAKAKKMCESFLLEGFLLVGFTPFPNDAGQREDVMKRQKTTEEGNQRKKKVRSRVFGGCFSLSEKSSLMLEMSA